MPDGHAKHVRSTVRSSSFSSIHNARLRESMDKDHTPAASSAASCRRLLSPSSRVRRRLRRAGLTHSGPYSSVGFGGLDCGSWGAAALVGGLHSGDGSNSHLSFRELCALCR